MDWKPTTSTLETCPICFDNILAGFAKFDTCIHMLCYDCANNLTQYTACCPCCSVYYNKCFLFNEMGELFKEVLLGDKEYETIRKNKTSHGIFYFLKYHLKR
jgi:hypothetical protein